MAFLTFLSINILTQKSTKNNQNCNTNVYQLRPFKTNIYNLILTDFEFRDVTTFWVFVKRSNLTEKMLKHSIVKGR